MLFVVSGLELFIEGCCLSWVHCFEECEDTCRKRAPDQPESSTAWDFVPKNPTELRAMKEAIIARRRKPAPRADEDVDMTFTEGSNVNIDITEPEPPPAWRGVFLR